MTQPAQIVHECAILSHQSGGLKHFLLPDEEGRGWCEIILSAGLLRCVTDDPFWYNEMTGKVWNNPGSKPKEFTPPLQPGAPSATTLWEQSQRSRMLLLERPSGVSRSLLRFLPPVSHTRKVSLNDDAGQHIVFLGKGDDTLISFTDQPTIRLAPRVLLKLWLAWESDSEVAISTGYQWRIQVQHSRLTFTHPSVITLNTHLPLSASRRLKLFDYLCSPTL